MSLEPWTRHPDRSGIVLDFDGTLAPIVDDPDTAAPLAGVAEQLAAMAERFGLVAVVSGRPIEYLETHFATGVVLAGLYGLEVSADGQRRDHPQGGCWREVIDDVGAHADAAGPDGVRVERKDLSITLHYREHPELAEEIELWAVAEARRSGLELRAARMSWELHPPIASDKGSTMLDLIDDLDAVCFVGDDLGDLPGFDALDQLDARGVATLRVAVASDEAPDALIERADLVVDGPAGVRDLLEGLAG